MTALHQCGAIVFTGETPMADRSKFEEMLKLLINENTEEAKELFHDIVVEKSRDIYESLLNEEAEEDDLDEADDEDTTESDDDDVSESSDDDEETNESDDDLEEGFDLDEFEVEADPAMGGDPTDDMLGDLGMDDGEEDGDMDMDMDDEGEGDVEDRVEDLEDALEDLKAEFEKMMSGDDGEDDMDDMGGDDEEDGDMDFGGDDEEPEEEAYSFESDDDDDDSDDEVKETKKSPKSASEQMREYVEKVGGDKYDSYGKMGDNGTNTKSLVAGKNDMGGTTSNILRTDTENSGEAGKPGGNIKGSALSDQNPKDMNTKNINVPGGKAGKTGFKKSEPGHGAEKKGKPDTADKAATSTLNKVSTRAK